MMLTDLDPTLEDLGLRCDCRCEISVIPHGRTSCTQPATHNVAVHLWGKCDDAGRVEALESFTAAELDLDGNVCMALCRPCLGFAMAGAQMLIDTILVRTNNPRGNCPTCGRPFTEPTDFVCATPI